MFTSDRTSTTAHAHAHTRMPHPNAANIWEGKDQSDEVTNNVREMFVEQIKWAKQAGVDFVIAETFGFLGEALLANRIIKEEFELPSVVTIVIHQDGKTRDG